AGMMAQPVSSWAWAAPAKSSEQASEVTDGTARMAFLLDCCLAAKLRDCGASSLQRRCGNVARRLSALRSAQSSVIRLLTRDARSRGTRRPMIATRAPAGCLLALSLLPAPRANDFARLDEAPPLTIDVAATHPVFDFDTDGCLPSAGVSRTGAQNGGL